MWVSDTLRRCQSIPLISSNGQETFNNFHWSSAISAAILMIFNNFIDKIGRLSFSQWHLIQFSSNCLFAILTFPISNFYSRFCWFCVNFLIQYFLRFLLKIYVNSMANWFDAGKKRQEKKEAFLGIFLKFFLSKSMISIIRIGKLKSKVFFMETSGRLCRKCQSPSFNLLFGFLLLNLIQKCFFFLFFLAKILVFWLQFSCIWRNKKKEKKKTLKFIANNWFLKEMK